VGTSTQALPKIAIVNQDLCPLVISDGFWSELPNLFYMNLIFNEILLTNVLKSEF